MKYKIEIIEPVYSNHGNSFNPGDILIGEDITPTHLPKSQMTKFKFDGHDYPEYLYSNEFKVIDTL